MYLKKRDGSEGEDPKRVPLCELVDGLHFAADSSSSRDLAAWLLSPVPALKPEVYIMAFSPYYLPSKDLSIK